jgi:tyrosyl-tRNA synthetase
MLLQAYDFYRLNQDFNCSLQAGGSDQWGNITAGLELIGRMSGAKAFGLTLPLVTKSDGTKFGKTESGTVWLDPKKTSPYQFYQFWINTDDNDVVKFLKYFTFLNEAEIADLENKVKTQPEKREAQRRLAKEVTELVHGVEARISAENITAALFSGDVGSLSRQEIEEAFQDVPSTVITRDDIPLVDLLIEAKAAPSKRQARQDIESGAVYINGTRLTDLDKTIGPADRLHGSYVVVRRGKKNYYLVKFQ